MFQKRLGQVDKVRVGEVLVKKGLITHEELTRALLEQRKTQTKLGEILIQLGLITRQQLNEALTEQQWRNWTAAVLLACGSFVAAVPKLAEVTAAVAVNPSAQSPKTTVAASGGASLFTNQASSQTEQPLGGQGFQTPLTANRNPSVESPLNGFCHPLNGLGYVSQGIRGTTHRGRMEYAYDLAASIGTPVYAMRTGRVIGVQDKYPDTGGGADKISQFNYVFVEHDGGYRSAYLHLRQGFRSEVKIKTGDTVEAGQLIGYSGNSGWSTGPHLHIELQRPGSAYSFTSTVPFAIAGVCQPSTIARK